MVITPVEKKAAEQYLLNGAPSRLAPEELARACDRMVREEIHQSAVSSVNLGRRFVRRAKSSGGILYLTALRAYGWALHWADRYAEAEKIYLEARTLAKTDPLARARIDRMLIDTYMYLGKPGEAKHRVRLALRTFGKLGADDEIAKTRVNYANVLHRQDRHREAHRLYSMAADHFRRRNKCI